MGTLGCINDMLRRDKENRELRKRGHERLTATRNRMLDVKKGEDYPNVSVEHLNQVIHQSKTQKENEQERFFRMKLVWMLIVLLLAIGIGGIIMLFIA